MLRELAKQLLNNELLTDAEVSGAIDELASADVSVEIKADFLTALAKKGETVGEIAAFAKKLRAMAIEPPIDSKTRALQILDVCGTGGDRLNTFNISTTVAIIAAADGVPVAKHGNRAVTSQAGSADVLEALGIKINAGPDAAARMLREHHFAFFFAPDYHPAFKQIGTARRLCSERGQKTIFNYLGPLLNPVRPALQLIGVPHPQLCLPIATVLQTLEVRRGMVVSGAVPPDGDKARNLDELSTLGENTVVEFHQPCALVASSLLPENFPIQPASLSDLAGGDRETNAAIVRRILRGEERGPKRDAVLLNAAAALFVVEKSRSIGEGWERAAKVIDSGKASAKLEDLIAAG
ncbi:MAG TPA: anthranilate phosphoribosyltransferase [Verrucomicrobiae bacterium]